MEGNVLGVGTKLILILFDANIRKIEDGVYGF